MKESPNKRIEFARVHIALTLFRAEKRRAWGEILVGPIENRVCFGTLYDADVNPVGANETLVVQLYAGLVITYSTDETGAKLILEHYRVIDSDDPVEPVKQVLEFRSATRIPAGYNSQGDESMVLVGDVVLVFRATWIDQETARTNAAEQCAPACPTRKSEALLSAAHAER